MVIPYITFSGSCAEALRFYAGVFGCEPAQARPYGAYVPEGLEHPPADLPQWVMHGEMEICGSRFWFADETEPVRAGNNVKLTLPVPTAAAARHIYEALAQGGTVVLPPTETFYSAFHAALEDRFGICWHLVAEEAPGA